MFNGLTIESINLSDRQYKGGKKKIEWC